MRIILAITTILIFATGCSSSNDADMIEGNNNAFDDPLYDPLFDPVVDQNEDELGPQSDDPDANEPPANEPPANEPDANEPDANEPDANEPDMVSTTINATNYEQVLKDVIGVLNIEDIDTLRNDAYLAEQDFFKVDIDVQAGETAPAGLEFLSEEVIPETETTRSIIKRQYACLSGGGYAINNVDFRGAPIYDRDVSFDNCQYMDVDYSGSYRKRGGRRSDWIDTFNNFVMVKNNQTRSITGTRNSVYQFVYNAEDLNWNGVSFSMMNDEGETKVTGMDWQRTGFHSVEIDTESYTVTDSAGQEQSINSTTYKSGLSANFQLASVSTAQAAVSVNANLEFEQNYFDWVNSYLITTPKPSYPVSDLGTPLTIVRPDATRTFDNLPRNLQSQWQSGSISIVAADGSRVTLQPSSDDSSQVLIELNESGEQIVKSWADGFSVYCSKLISGCGNEAIELE